MTNPYDDAAPKVIKRDTPLEQGGLRSAMSKVSLSDAELPPITEGTIVTGPLSSSVGSMVGSPTHKEPMIPVFSEESMKLLRTVAQAQLKEVVEEKYGTQTASETTEQANNPTDNTSNDALDEKEEIRKEVRGQYLKAIAEKSYDNNEIDNAEVRAEVEKRTSEMDLSSLIINGTVSQVVAVLPSNKLTVTFRSPKKKERHWLDSYVLAKLPTPDYPENESAKDANERIRALEKVTIERNLLTVDGLMVLQIAAIATGNFNFPLRDLFMGGNKLPSNTDFEHNLDVLRDMDSNLVYLLSVNLRWFNDRVKALYSEDFTKLKNT